MQDALRKAAEFEHGFMDAVVEKINKTRQEFRHEWSEPVQAEWDSWGELSPALKALNERCCIWGRPGIPWGEEKKPPPLSKITVKDGVWVNDVLKAHIPAYGGKVWRLPMDGKYYMVDQQMMAVIIGYGWTKVKAWISDRYDCDDFSKSFAAYVSDTFLLNQVGMVIDHSSFHAYNVILFSDDKVWFFEPNSKPPLEQRIVNIGSGGYKLETGVVLL